MIHSIIQQLNPKLDLLFDGNAYIPYQPRWIMGTVTFAQRPIDEGTVRTLYEQWMDGWNKGSAASFSAPFAEDGDLIGFDGTHLKGRHEIAAFHQPLFDKWLKGTRLVGEVKSVRFLTPKLAVMHATRGTIMWGKSEPSPERDSIQTLIATKTGANGDSRRFKIRGSGPWAVALAQPSCCYCPTGYASCLARRNENEEPVWVKCAMRRRSISGWRRRSICRRALFFWHGCSVLESSGGDVAALAR